MQDAAFTAYRRRKTLWSYSLWMLGLLLVHALVFNSIFLWVTSDVLLKDTVLSLILNILSDVFNYLFYWVSFAFLIFAMARFSLGTALGIGGIFMSGMALRYLLDTLVGYLIMGFPTLDDFWYSLSELGIVLAFDLVLAAIAFLFIYVFVASAKASLEKKTVVAAWMPPRSFWHLRNPILKAAFVSSAVVGSVQILYRIYYDVAFIGAPTGTVDLLWMITYYLSDLLMILIGYIVIQLFLNQLYMKELRSEELYASKES